LRVEEDIFFSAALFVNDIRTKNPVNDKTQILTNAFVFIRYYPS
jgi:hypothetical protein